MIVAIIKMKQNEVFDTIVIGAGINGSFAALHLAKKGKKTALLEQFPLPNERSSSTGQSRFLRIAHFSPDGFNPLVQDSIRQWLQLEKDSKQSLLRKEKVFFLCKKSDPKDLQVLSASMVKNGITPVIQSIQEFNEEYKTTYDDDMIVLVDTEAGILMASKCVQAVQDLFVSCGGIIIDEYPVTNVCVSSKNNNVLVHGSKGCLEAKSAIICAGPWTDRLLLPLGIDLPLEPQKVGVFYWPVLDTTRKTFAFVDSCSLKGFAYGLPDIEYPGLIKLGYHGGVPCDPSHRDLKGLEEIKSQVERYIQKYIPWVGTKTVVEESCMYTVTPDTEMIIDQHPVHKNIAFATGFSGTGFKTGPTIGQILGELVTDSTCSFDISAFRMNRFKQSLRASYLSKL